MENSMSFDKNKELKSITDFLSSEIKNATDKVMACAIYIAQFEEDSDEFVFALSTLKGYVRDEFGRKSADNLHNYVMGKLHKLQRAHQDIKPIVVEEKQAEQIIPTIPLDDERILYESVVINAEVKEEIVQPKPTIQPKARSNKPQPRKK
jgi:hypothetical protein